MGGVRSLAGAFVSIGLLMCAAHSAGGKGQTLTLPVPERVAAQAAARSTGEASVPVPILVLENVELPSGERLSIVVHGPAEPGSTKPGQELGRATMVGSHEEAPASPRRMTLVVPLSDAALGLLAGKREVTLTLSVEDGRSMPDFERAYFDDGEED